MKNKINPNTVKVLLITVFAVVTFAFFNNNVYAASAGDTSGTGSFFIPNISINFADAAAGADDPQRTVDSLQILVLITVLSLSPYLLVMLTAFTRIIIVLHFLRSALGTQQMPPNQVLMGLALFLTFFIMGNTFTKINDTAIQPMIRGEITSEVAIEEGIKPLREFMLNNANDKDINLFLGLAGVEAESDDDVPTSVIIPAFILTEIKAGFIFGFVLFLPFIAIDMVVASVLMAMGMMMLPPAMISLPFKIMLFILADGWNWVIIYLVEAFVIAV